MMKLAWLLTCVEDESVRPELYKEYPEFYDWDNDYTITRIVYAEVEDNE
jgi:hypothetical protein